MKEATGAPPYWYTSRPSSNGMGANMASESTGRWEVEGDGKWREMGSGGGWEVEGGGKIEEEKVAYL